MRLFIFLADVRREATAFRSGWPSLTLDGTDWLVLLTLLLLILTFVGVYVTWRHYRLAQQTSEPEATFILPMPAQSGRNLDTTPDPRNYPPSEADSLGLRVPTEFAPPFLVTKDGRTVVPKASAEPEPAGPKIEPSTREADRQTSDSPKPKRRKPNPKAPPPPRAEWEDLMDETVTVPAGYGQHWATRLDLEEGDEIRGTLTEVDDDEFSYIVLDESNYAAFRGGDDYEVVDEAEETSSVRVDFSVDETNRYYIVLYAYGKRIDREVEVSLRTRSRNP
jgi:hypothetical protein